MIRGHDAEIRSRTVSVEVRAAERAKAGPREQARTRGS